MSAKIKEAYLDYLLEHGEAPPSVYQFTKSLKMKEAAFYEHYNSFTALERDVWRGFFDQTLERIQSEDVYREYSVREKLLADTNYFTPVILANEHLLKGGASAANI